MGSACETCAYFRTGTEFLPIVVRQRDLARDYGKPGRAHRGRQATHSPPLTQSHMHSAKPTN